MIKLDWFRFAVPARQFAAWFVCMAFILIVGPTLSDLVFAEDSDGDGYDDVTGEYIDPAAGGNDSDGDFFTDDDEMAAGTNPNDPSDFPGSTTEDPIDYGSGTDSDGDFFTDDEEMEAGTNPNDPNDYPGSTSGDPTDYEYGTDSDGDNYSDDEEMEAGTNPNDPSSYPGSDGGTGDDSGAWDSSMGAYPDGGYDTDGDGLSDDYESINGFDYEHFVYVWDEDAQTEIFSHTEWRRDGLDPYNPDSDGDGLNDGVEMLELTPMLEALGLAYTFDPIDPTDGAADWDGDLLSNAFEINETHSNFLTQHSDTDEYDDFQEWGMDTDPNDPDDPPTPDPDGGEGGDGPTTGGDGDGEPTGDDSDDSGDDDTTDGEEEDTDPDDGTEDPDTDSTTYTAGYSLGVRWAFGGGSTDSNGIQSTHSVSSGTPDLVSDSMTSFQLAGDFHPFLGSPVEAVKLSSTASGHSQVYARHVRYPSYSGGQAEENHQVQMIEYQWNNVQQVAAEESIRYVLRNRKINYLTNETEIRNYLITVTLTEEGGVNVAMDGECGDVLVQSDLGKITVVPTQPNEGLNEFTLGLLELEFEYVKLLDDGSVELVGAMPISDPAPTVEISTFEAEIVNQEDESFEVSITLEGILDDALADITPGTTGVIDRGYLIINDDEWIPLQIEHTKQESGPLGHKQYDYSGTINETVIATSAVEGLNTAKVLVVGPSGNDGYSLHTFTIASQFDVAGGTVVDFKFDAPLSSSTEDSLTVYSSGETFAATETEIDSGIFHWTDLFGTDRKIEIAPAEATMLSGLEVDTFPVRVAVLSESANELELDVEETGENTLRFQADLFITNHAYYISDIDFIERSEPGIFHPVLLRLKDSGGLFADPNSAEEDDWTLTLDFSYTSKLTEPSESENPGPIWTPAEDQSRTFITRPESEDEHLYLSNESGEDAAVIVATPPHAEPGWLSPVIGTVENWKEQLMDPTTRGEGVDNGIVLGGLNLVSDGLRLVEWGGAKGETYVDVIAEKGYNGFVGQWNEDWQSLVDVHVHSQEFIGLIADFVGLDATSMADMTIVLNAQWNGEEGSDESLNALSRLGSKYTENFAIAAEIWAYAVEEVKALPEPQQGLILGQLMFEIIALAAPATKASKLTKSEGIAKLSEGKFSKTPEGTVVFARVADFAEEVLTTKMCFVAGTPVLTSEGLLPIESIRPGMDVWAKHEKTKLEAWRPVVQTFTTHPGELWTVSFDTDEDGIGDEELTGTGEHPFWVEELGEFLPLRELKSGMRLYIANETGQAIVTGNISKRGPPGHTFTTYNFEVEDFHTYFVGEAGVWVHNMSRWGVCEDWFAEYTAFKRTANGDHWKAMGDAILAKKRALKAEGKKLPMHQTNSVYNEVLDDFLADGGDLKDAADIPEALTHEIPIDRAFREQHQRKVYGHWHEGDPDLPAGKKKTADRMVGDAELQVEYKRVDAGVSDVETKVKRLIEAAFEKKNKGQGLDEIVIDGSLHPGVTDEVITAAITRAMGNSNSVSGIKYWRFDGTNLIEHSVR